MRKFLFLFLLIACFPLTAAAQGNWFTSIVLSGAGRPIAGATVTVCAYNPSDYSSVPPTPWDIYTGTVPCPSKASIFSNIGLTVPQINGSGNPSFLSDGLGNYGFYGSASIYTVCITGQSVTGSCAALVGGGGSGGGSITTVTSSDSTVTITNPSGPTTNLSVCPDSISIRSALFVNPVGSCAGNPQFLFSLGGYPTTQAGLFVGPQESTLPSEMQGWFNGNFPSFPTSLEVVSGPGSTTSGAEFLAYNQGVSGSFLSYEDDAGCSGCEMQGLEVDAVTGNSSNTISEAIGVDIHVGQVAGHGPITAAENIKFEWGSSFPAGSIGTARGLWVQPIQHVSGSTITTAYGAEFDVVGGCGSGGITTQIGIAIGTSGISSPPCQAAIYIGNGLAFNTTGYFDIQQISTPSNPASGTQRFYAGTGGSLQCLTSTGGSCLNSVQLQTNTVNNTLQSLLNLKAGSNVTLTADGSGGVTIAASGSGGATTPGGSSGQIQYNSSGVFGGFTASGGATINTSTGVVTLGNPGASTLGGIESITCASHTWVNLINTSGVPSCTQPSYSDISGTPSVAFSGLTSSTNTTAAMLVGTGASLGPTASGTITANALSAGTYANIYTFSNASNAFTGSLTGNASTATALASIPTQCTGINFATGIAANGNANCSSPFGSLFYQTLKSNGTSQTQRSAINFSTMFSLSDSASPSQTNVDLSTVDVPHGGTGLATLTAHSLVIGEGTSAVNLTAAPSSASVASYITQVSGSDPAPQLAGIAQRAVSGTTDTILNTDRANQVIYSSNSAVAVTLPQSPTTDFGSDFTTNVNSTGTGDVTFTPATGTCNGAATCILPHGLHGTLVSNNTNYVLVLSGAVISGNLTTTSATTDSLTLNGLLSTSHCVFSASNSTAATNIATSFISTVAANSVTLTHTATSGLVYTIACTIQ